MKKEELINLFDEFVLRNAKHVCSATGVRALSSLADAKNKLNDKAHAQYFADPKYVAKFILEQRDLLYAVLPKKFDILSHPNERLAYDNLIQICNELYAKP
jgi:hypothetical protein